MYVDPRVPARRIAWLIAIVGAIGAVMWLVRWVFQSQISTLTFNTHQIGGLGLLWLLVGAVALVMLSGNSQGRTAQIARERAAHVVPSQGTEMMSVAPPNTMSRAQSVSNEPDNLQVIEGIGPKVEEALNKSGIKSYVQVAETSAEELFRIVKIDHGVRLVGNSATDSWPEQAKLLAQGRMAELKALQDRLTAGGDLRAGSREITED